VSKAGVLSPALDSAIRRIRTWRRWLKKANFDHPVVGAPGTQMKEIAATIMHELTHQLEPLKTNDSISYIGAGGEVSKCSAKDAERVGREAVRW
jgi:hypothetical protein